MVDKISVVAPCFNEAKNIQSYYQRTIEALNEIGDICYEIIFIDNASTDETVKLLNDIANNDQNVKVILNSRNFGIVRSAAHAVLQAEGDAVVTMASDLQDPPEMLPQFVNRWREGYEVVVGVHPNADEFFLMKLIRNYYYKLTSKLADISLIKNYSSYGLFDKKIINEFRKMNDPYPYFRGIVSEIGFSVDTIEFIKPIRKKGKSSYNLYTLFDVAMLGITSHSKVPLRIATFLGFLFSGLSLLASFFYFIYKLLNWDSFSIGIAPIVFGLFLFSSIQLFFIGIVGEYIGFIHTRVLNRPLVVEKERINF